MAQIIWAPQALRDLEQIVHFIARNAPATARRYGQKLVARVEQLRHQPLSGGWIEEDDTHTYRQ